MIYSQGSILFIGTYSDFIDQLFSGTKHNYSGAHNLSQIICWGKLILKEKINNKQIQDQQYHDLWAWIFQSLDKIKSCAKVKPPY